jgi:hypothetical protein
MPGRWAKPSGYPGSMKRDEAEALREQLQSEHEDRATHTFMVREAGPGDWEVVKVSLPPRRPVGTTVEAKPRPPQSDHAPLWQSTGGVPPNVGPG